MLSLKDYEKLRKLMQMTLSDRDGECLNAIRMANGLLLKANFNWEDLFAAKVKVEGISAEGIRKPSGPSPYAKLTPQDEDELEAAFEYYLRDLPTGGFRDFIQAMHDTWEATGKLTERQYEAVIKNYHKPQRRGTAW